MENYLMNYDKQTGEIKGFYLKSVHGGNIPTPILEITPEKHSFYINNNGKYKINIVTLADELAPVIVPPIQEDSNVLTLESLTEIVENLILGLL